MKTNKQGPVFELHSAVKKGNKNEMNQLCERFELSKTDLERVIEYEKKKGFVEKQVLSRLRSFFDKYSSFSRRREYQEVFYGTLDQFAKDYSFYLSLAEKEVALRIIERHEVKPNRRELSEPISRLYQRGELIASSVKKETELSEDIMEINSLGLYVLGENYERLKRGDCGSLSPFFGSGPEWRSLHINTRESYFEGDISGITNIWGSERKDRLLILKFSHQCTQGRCDFGYRPSYKFLEALKKKEIEVEYKFKQKD